MRHHRPLLCLGLFAMLPLAAPALAGDSLSDEVAELRRQATSLQAQRRVHLEQAIHRYLGDAGSRGAQGGDALKGVSISARFTTVTLGTVGADPFNRTVANGNVAVDFDFEVTDNLDLFVHLVANTSGRFPSEFGSISGVTGATLSGLGDGVGVDGTTPTSPGSARVYEAGIVYRQPLGDNTVHIMMGAIDARNGFAQNAFANDENTQFLNNLFDDPPAMSWRTTAAGRTEFGVQFWTFFGSDKQYRVDFGWFNRSGQFFNKGLALWQVAWRSELTGRELNVRVYGQLDGSTDDIAAAVGVSADWWATDQIGVFVRVTVRDNQRLVTGETNPIESDWSVGGMGRGLIESRPDDVIGLAAGLIKGNISDFSPAFSTVTENHEIVIEIYYRYVMEGGKLQITPLAQFILDPGAGGFDTNQDTLVILGVRVHVPF